MILKIENVTKYYGMKCILNDISLAIDKPKIIGLVAPNGSGKTTLFNIISNLEKPNAGVITIFSNPNTETKIFNDLAYVQDNRVLYENLTAKEHLEFIATCHRREKWEIESTVNRLGMKSYLDKQVRFYSLGMKQHLLLAMVLLSRPKLLLLDEPLNGLDPSSSKLFREMMMELYTDGTTIIMSSHNLEEIEKLTTEVYFLIEGNLIHSDEIEIKQEYLYIVENSYYIVSLLDQEYGCIEIKNKHELILRATKSEKNFFDTFCSTHDITQYDCLNRDNPLEKAYFSLFISEKDERGDE